MEESPKDVIMLFALESDLPTLSSFCQTSKRFNEMICKNNTFWINKLYKDFGVNFLESEFFLNLPRSERLKNIYIKREVPARKYYLEISKWLEDYPNIDELYSHAISEGRLDLVKIALDRGADVNYLPLGQGKYPLVRAAIFNQPEIFDYILDKSLNSKGTVLHILKQFFISIETPQPVSDKIKLFILLDDKILPGLISLLGESDDTRRLWRMSAIKLKETYERFPEELQDVYDRRYEQFRKLGE